MNFKKTLFTFGLLTLCLSACGSNDSPSAAPGAAPQVETSPDTAQGDWIIAQNLSESIYDARSIWIAPNKLQIEVSYYDIDHLDDSTGFLKKVKFIANLRNEEVSSNNPRFNATVDCSRGCEEGSLFIGHLSSAGTHSKLDGTAQINFFMKPFRGVTRVINGTPASSASEYHIVNGLTNYFVAGGIAEGFEIEGGFAHPYRMILHVGARHAGPVIDPRFPNYLIDFSTTKIDASAPVQVTYSKYPNNILSYEAIKTFKDGISIQFDFTNAGTLKSVKSN